MKLMQEMIRSATKSLWIEMYLFDTDHVAQMLLDQKEAYPHLDLRLLYHQPALPPSLDPTGRKRFPAWVLPNKGYGRTASQFPCIMPNFCLSMRMCQARPKHIL
jgi:hypothetical protein